MQTELAALYRREYGALLATLVRVARDFALAEEMLQEAFETALVQWPSSGLPPNPVGWLMNTARHKIIDQQRRRAFMLRNQEELARLSEAQLHASDHAPAHDDTLRLLFTCCHPALASEAQVALALRSICGLTTEEIAHAFVVPVATMAQRIVRAKAKLKQDAVPYEVPEAGALPERLSSVSLVAYLVFNEGYAASHGDTVVRVDLCLEAIRLARALAELMPNEPEPRALLALMLLYHARHATRSDGDGAFVPLEEQERSRWNRSEIDEGVALIQHVFREGQVGSYAVQAAIAALHATASSVEQTDWPQITALYGLLYAQQPTPIIALNRAVAHGMAFGFEQGLAALATIELPGYHLLPAARADFLRRLGRHQEARTAYLEALSLATSEPDRRYLQTRLHALDEQSDTIL